MVKSVEARVNSQETSVSQCISAAKGAQPKSQRGQWKTQGQKTSNSCDLIAWRFSRFRMKEALADLGIIKLWADRPLWEGKN